MRSLRMMTYSSWVSILADLEACRNTKKNVKIVKCFQIQCVHLVEACQFLTIQLIGVIKSFVCTSVKGYRGGNSSTATSIKL